MSVFNLSSISCKAIVRPFPRCEFSFVLTEGHSRLRVPSIRVRQQSEFQDRALGLKLLQCHVGCLAAQWFVVCIICSWRLDFSLVSHRRFNTGSAWNSEAQRGTSAPHRIFSRADTR